MTQMLWAAVFLYWMRGRNMRLTWDELLLGLNPRRIDGDVYSVYVDVLGKSEIGPCNRLRAFVDKADIYVLSVQVHHIVNGEHLFGTGWTYEDAPCIVLSRLTHEQYHARFSEVLPEYHGRSDAGRIGRRHALQLYHDMFVEQTSWHQLWMIAARVLTNRVRVPIKTSFWRGEL